jgi:hypothetical protein
MTEGMRQLRRMRQLQCDEESRELIGHRSGGGELLGGCAREAAVREEQGVP